MALILWISLTFVFFWYSDDIEFLFKNAIATVFFGVDVEKRAFEQLYLSQWIAYCFHGSNHFSTDFYSDLKFFVYLMSFLLSQDLFLILIGCICFFCNIFTPSELETAQVSYPGCISDRFLLFSHRTNEHITFFSENSELHLWRRISVFLIFMNVWACVILLLFS